MHFTGNDDDQTMLTGELGQAQLSVPYVSTVALFATIIAAGRVFCNEMIVAEVAA